MSKRILLLNEVQIKQKIKRISYQIFENNQKETKLYFCGIGERGVFISELIIQEFKKLIDIETEKINVTINNLEIKIESECKDKNLNIKDSTIILVDDVLNTGLTLMSAITTIFKYQPKRIETCFLAQRNHRMFPVTGDYVGLKLATTFQEHIYFDISNPKEICLYIE